jgi:hypothetical protein
VYIFCKWYKEAKFANQMAKGISVYRKEMIDKHVKVKDHLIADKKK